MTRRSWILAALIPSFGCGGASQSSSPTAADNLALKREALAGAPEAPPAKGGKPAADDVPIERKIIYSATVEVVVKNLDETVPPVEKLIADLKGYIAKTDFSGNTGSKRTAVWTLKIPADKFREAVTALAALGTPVKNSSDSQDVTEEFVDLQARVKNLRAEEETLNKLLKDQAVRLDDVLKIREQIKNVRGDIERAEGRMKYLSTMAAMSTITFTAREDAAYIPPAPAAAPTFGDSVDSTFSGSVDALTKFGKGVVLFVVALSPWLPIIIVALLLARWSIKKFIRVVNAGTAPPPRREPRKAKPVQQEVEEPEMLPEPEKDERTG